MKKKEFYIPSRDGVHRLHVVLGAGDRGKGGRADFPRYDRDD